MRTLRKRPGNVPFAPSPEGDVKLEIPLARPAKRKHRLGFIASQSEIKDVKVVPHVNVVCCASERQHSELDSETKYYLWNRLVVVTGDLGHAWFLENLAISGK